MAFKARTFPVFAETRKTLKLFVLRNPGRKPLRTYAGIALGDLALVAAVAVDDAQGADAVDRGAEQEALDLAAAFLS
jgi:hypothetical protein